MGDCNDTVDDQEVADLVATILAEVRSSTSIDGETLPRLAWHEACHAVAAVLVGGEVHSANLDHARGIGYTPCRTGDDFLDAVISMAPCWPSRGPSRYDVADAIALVGRDRLQAAAEHAARVLAGYRDTIGQVAAELAVHGSVSGARIVEIVVTAARSTRTPRPDTSGPAPAQ